MQRLRLPAKWFIVPAVVIVSLPLAAGCQRTSPPLRVYSGSIEAEETRVVSQVGGQVLRMLVEDGDELAADQVVAELDDTDARLEVRRAEAAVSSLQAQLRDLQAGSRAEQVRQAEANLQAAEAALRGADRDLTFKQDNLARVQQLFAAAAVDRQQVDQARMQVDAANSRRQQAAAQQEAALAQLKLVQAGASSHAIQALEANIQQAEATRDLARLRVAKSTVKTVPGGTVVSVNVKPGETVSPGAGIVTLVDLSRLWVKVFIPETHLNLLAVGNRVKVVVDAYPDRTFAGEVVWISARAEFTPQNVQTREERVDTVFSVKVKLLEGLDELKPGIPADVYLSGA